MNAIATPDHLGVLFALAAFIAYMGFVLLVARICGTNDRLARRQREAEMLETDHPATSISAYVRDCQDRDKRARFRHSTRYGRSA